MVAFFKKWCYNIWYTAIKKVNLWQENVLFVQNERQQATMSLTQRDTQDGLLVQTCTKEI